MPKQQPEKGPPKKEVYVDLVSPKGKVIPTLDWVAEGLLKKGWKKKSDGPTIKKEPNNGETKNQ